MSKFIKRERNIEPHYRINCKKKYLYLKMRQKRKIHTTKRRRIPKELSKIIIRRQRDDVLSKTSNDDNLKK